jgi:hypothetical protein
VSGLRVALLVLAGAPLWAAGTVFFDAVHWVLHGFLRSRWRLLRWIAWPHSVHHQWLDARLEISWEKQRANVWCHIVPEYLTQLAFSAALLLVLPGPTVIACMVVQTGVFLFILRERGLDINHRPIEMLDAYRPSWLCPPAYHALHHVWPDSHFSAYSKLVDWVVGGGLRLRGRRIGLAGAGGPFGRALAERIAREAPAAMRDLTGPEDPALAQIDLLILCEPAPDETAWIENLIRLSRERQLPPEVWAVHTRPDDGLARFYYRDVRVIYRTLVAREADLRDERRARRAARTALFFARHGCLYVPTSAGALRAHRRFRATAPVRPAEGLAVRHRSELRAA